MSRIRSIAGVSPAGMLCVTAHAEDLATAEWNQRRGNAGRTGVVDVEPIRAQPAVAR